MGIISGSMSSVRSPTPSGSSGAACLLPGSQLSRCILELRTQAASGNLHLPTFLSCPGLGSRSPDTQPYHLPPPSNHPISI